MSTSRSHASNGGTNGSGTFFSQAGSFAPARLGTRCSSSARRIQCGGRADPVTKARRYRDGSEGTVRPVYHPHALRAKLSRLTLRAGAAEIPAAARFG
ncbi:MAG: hypothetical protein JW751_22235 [Polyangiaceae bacterium]|nr:hypothetical protein [Polyangiaceae bacterium]